MKIEPCSFGWRDLVDHRCGGHRRGTLHHTCPCGVMRLIGYEESALDRIRAYIAEFLAENSDARVWAEDIIHGNDDEEPDDLPACEGMSAAFRDFLLAHDIEAYVIEADDPEHEDASYHQFTRIPDPDGDINVDWTARQFRNLDYPRNPLHYSQTETVPLVWRGHACQHPISDLSFKTEKRIDA